MLQVGVGGHGGIRSGLSVERHVLLERLHPRHWNRDVIRAVLH